MEQTAFNFNLRRPGKRRALNKENEADTMIGKVVKLKAGVYAKVEHLSRAIKCQFGIVKSGSNPLLLGGSVCSFHGGR
jgi:hypothetical protein